MTDSIKAAANSGALASGLERQIADLQRQCADWRGCATTSPTDKQQQISELGGQIQSLKIQLEKIDLDKTQHVNQVSSTADVREQALASPSQIADGINRPDQDAFALSGSVINLSV